MAGRQRWIVPLAGVVRSGKSQVTIGECLLLDPNEQLEVDDGAVALLAVDGAPDLS